MKHVDHQIQAYCDGELSPALRAAFEAHVRECAACRGELAATRQLWERVDAAATVPAPQPTWTALEERIAGRRPSQPWTWSQRGLAVAAMVAGVVIGFEFGGAVADTDDAATVSVDYLEESLPTLDQSWLQLGDESEDVGS